MELGMDAGKAAEDIAGFALVEDFPERQRVVRRSGLTLREVDNMPYLFAHGTFRKGGRNNNLIESAISLGHAVTEQDYALYTIKGKPVVTKLPQTKIKGEVYAVSDEALTLVDRLEGHPRINKRDLVPVKLEDGNTVEAWLYFHIQPLRESVLIESGEYPI
jgi:gamma-glutamylcyclotransferase (GGCT)/AIG2-like uncharacterized protein YtfP